MNSTNQVKSIGMDIGGANIKLSDGSSWHHHEPFALWQHPESLAEKLHVLLNAGPAHDLVAVTMTGELTDCFANKRSGVEFIVDQMSHATDRMIRFYLLDGQFVNAANARSDYMLAAASNWHALASYAAAFVADGKPGLLIDVGSTTTDVIAFVDAHVSARGSDDFSRLVNSELVYTGAIRSSLAGIVNSVTHRGLTSPVMNEMFATTLDTNILLGHLPPDENEFYTADGESTALHACVRRVARLIGKDNLTFDLDDAKEIARQIFETQIEIVANAVANVLEEFQICDPTLVLSGQGEFLAAAVAERLASSNSIHATIRMTEQLDPLASSCATALAIANLANHEIPKEEASSVAGEVSS